MWTRTVAVGCITALLTLAPAASAFEAIRFSEVEGLKGTEVFVEVPVEVRWKKPFRSAQLLVGDKLTLKGRLEGQIDAWCVVADAKGEEWEVMVQHLSKTAPSYSMAAPGTIEELLPKIASAAADIPPKLAALWQAQNYELDDEGRALRTAYESAYERHAGLAVKLIGGRVSKSSVLGNEQFKWLWTADASVLDAYCEGITYMEKYKGSELVTKAKAIRDFLNASGGIQSTCGEIMRVRDELKRKPWLNSVKKDVPEAAKKALDEEETGKRQKRLETLEERLASQLKSLPESRTKLGL